VARVGPESWPSDPPSRYARAADGLTGAYSAYALEQFARIAIARIDFQGGAELRDPRVDATFIDLQQRFALKRIGLLASKDGLSFCVSDVLKSRKDGLFDLREGPEIPRIARNGAEREMVFQVWKVVGVPQIPRIVPGRRRRR
jgi:hypothetical protein